MPGSDEKVEKNEGVGSNCAGPKHGELLENGGKVWNPVSSHTVSALLKISDRVVAASARRRSQQLYASVVSVYAPTHIGQARKIRTWFFDDLPGVKGISADHLLIVGDFNARVGSGERGDSWAGVRGCHGVGLVNDNREALLSWCAQNGLAVMNTMFQKKRIHSTHGSTREANSGIALTMC